MIASTPQPTGRIGAVIIADDQRGPRGLPARWHDELDNQIILRHTVDRLRETDLDDVIVVCPPGIGVGFEDVKNFHSTAPLTDAVHDRAVAARKWSPNCWRGGIGGATVYDELIVAAPMLEAMQAHQLDAVFVVGPDWPRLDPQLCNAVIARYRENPAANPLTFSQAPPGLCGIVIDRSLLEQMQADGAMFGSMIDYNPRAPQADPIAKNVCVQIEPLIRQQMRRFTWDAQRWIEELNHGGRGGTEAQRENLVPNSASPRLRGLREYQQMVIELTPERPATGPITLQHHAAIERPPMSLDDAKRIIDRAAEVDDMAITFGGLGDALCHPHWAELVEHARAVGIYGIHLETDLHVDQPTLERLAALPIDVLSVRLNADSPETYANLMGGDDLYVIMKRIEWLLNHRQSGGLQWVVPRMVKTTDNVHELESFVDRWTYFAGHAVIERPPIREQAVIDMSAGYKLADGWKRDVLHVLSNGMVVEENDWLGESAECSIFDVQCSV